MTASLGELAARIRVRQLQEGESLLLGALHLQSLRRAGIEPDPGPPSHVVAFASSWRQRSAALPAWVAERDGQHVGMAICRVPLLPHVGSGVPELVVLTALDGQRTRVAVGSAAGLDAEATCLALVRAMVGWFGREGYLSVEVAPDVEVPAPVLDAARADVLAGRRVSLPTRP